jgi:hypothetical protein
MGGCGLDSSGSGKGPVARSCEHGNEPSGSVKVEGFPECPRTTGFARKAQLHGVSFLLQLIL